MEDRLYSNKSAKGFDDFSYSLFAFLDVFAILDMADGLASRRWEKQDAAQVRFSMPSPV